MAHRIVLGLVLAVLLGAYTGFLLSALKSYPFLNNPILPVLFLFSGISSGAAVALIAMALRHRSNPHSTEAHFVHRMEVPVVWLEIFLLVRNPWQVVLTTDHPNGGPFTSYPHLIRLLMDRSFREEQLAKLHPEVAQFSALKSITRELTLQEIAILTRAAPAKLLGLRDRGHLGEGAAADIAVYRDDADRERMFTAPELVFKDGVLVSRAGRLTAEPVGGTHFVAPDYDLSFAQTLRRRHARHGSVNPDHLVIGHDELCACGRGGALLPVACLQGQDRGAP